MDQSDTDRHNGDVLARTENHSVIDCESCGFAHITPLPSEEELEQFYADQFYETEVPDYLKGPAEDAAWIDLEFSERFKSFQQLLGADGGTILDVGSGTGNFLVTAGDMGWQAVGIEPSTVAADYARERGLETLNAPFNEENTTDLGPFDVIHLNKVLEHVARPEKLLRLAARLVRPGGIVCAAVPNDFNAFQQAFVQNSGAANWWVVPGHHINYFNFVSLEALFRKVGLEPVKRESDFPMEMFLLMGDDYTANPELGKSLHGKRKAFDLAMAAFGQNLRQNFYGALAAAGLGRQAIVFAQKPG